MNQHHLPLPYERRLRDLELLYQQAARELAARVEYALESGELLTARRLRLQLAAALAVLDQLGAAVRPLARELVADAWAESAELAARQIAALRIAIPEIPGAFAGVSREAVAQLQASLLDRLDAAHQTVGRRVADVFARRQRHAAVRALLGTDGSPRASARWLEQQLRESTTGFVDRAGRRWSLDAYARMATRTVTREAVVQGAVARIAAHQINLARVSTHAGACGTCQPMEGRLISLDGETTEHLGEPVYSPDSLPPFHPNCAHTIMPVAAGVEVLKQEMQDEQRATLDRLSAAGVLGA